MKSLQIETKNGNILSDNLTDAPDMDWWLKGLKGGTKGNVRLMTVFSKLTDWLEQEEPVSTAG